MSDVIKVTRQTIESLPLWYRALAQVMQEKGELVIQDTKAPAGESA